MRQKITGQNEIELKSINRPTHKIDKHLLGI